MKVKYQFRRQCFTLHTQVKPVLQREQIKDVI
jgi:hypothetical protein